MSDGTGLKTLLLQGGFALFTADGNFIVGPGIKEATIDAIAGGGGGGGGRGSYCGERPAGGVRWWRRAPASR